MSVYFYGCITMDGYLADKHHEIDWLNQQGGIEETDFDLFYRQMDITIMGKRTYEEVSKTENACAVYPTTKNYVLTHSAFLSQEGFTPINCDIVEFVKGFETENIWIVGGNTVLSPLLDMNMVDCIILQIAPVLLGEGIPLFAQKEGFKQFALKQVKQYGPFAELTFCKI